MTKPDSELIKSPVDELCGNPDKLKSGGGTWDGEKNLPKRTTGGDGVPERTRDADGPSQS